VAGNHWMRSEDSDEPNPSFDTSTAHIARIYNYLLGGKDNYAADREAAEAAIKAYPQAVTTARANRAFLERTVRYLASEQGIRQFLDIGTGLPSANNTHEVAQDAAPDARIVYADNDPIVLTHARALLTSKPEGRTAYIEADLRGTATILASAAGTLDFTQPVAVMLLAILHCIPDEDDPWRIVRELTHAVPAGSFLVISHPTSDIHTGVTQAYRSARPMMNEPLTFRGRDQVSRFFDGLDLVEPGLVPIQEWRPRSELEASAKAAFWSGVARKPAA
jgi:hypothetical protein